MNLNEARAKYPNGSKVRVVRPGAIYSSFDWWAAKYLEYEQYHSWKYFDAEIRKGDIGEVICVHPHSREEHTIIAAIKIDAKKVYLIDVDAIECEQSTPFMNDYHPLFHDVVEEKEEEEDSLKYRCGFDGENLIVTAFGQSVTRNMTELLDEMVSECEALSNKISVGDRVQIEDRDYTYASYDDFVKRYLCFDQAMAWQYGRYPDNGSVGKVIIMKPHLRGLPEQVCVVEIDGEDSPFPAIYLIGAGGLKRMVD